VDRTRVQGRRGAAQPPRQHGDHAPLVKGAYVGQELDDATRQRIYAEGARTSPGREHGGNIDIGALVRGSKVYLPVYVPGANLSVGDLHFCEADGEPTTAIEMPGVVTLRVNLIRGGIRALGIHTPMYETSPSEVLYRNRLVFTGLSVTPEGEQTDRDGMVSYRNAAFSAMQYLGKMGYSREQAHVLMSAAPIEVKVVATANQPNYVVSVGLPVDIFEFDIRPRALGEPKPAISGPAVLSEERAAKEVAANGVANGNGHANGH
jgi:formamidase